MNRRHDTRTLLSASDPSPLPWASDEEISATVFVPPDVYARALAADDAPATARTTPVPALPVRHLARMGTEVMAFNLPARVPVPVTPERGPLPPRVAAVEPAARAVEADGAARRPDSARVRSALDEMSMVVDVSALPARLANASDADVDRVLNALRRSEGLDLAVAPAPVVVSGGAPSMALQAPVLDWPAPSWPAPRASWAPAPPAASVASWPVGPLPAASVVAPAAGRRSTSGLAFVLAALVGLALGTGAALALFGQPHAHPATGGIELRARAAASMVRVSMTSSAERPASLDVLALTSR